MHLDFETYSKANLPEVGAYRYAQDPSTEVLILCFVGGDGDPAVYLPHKHGTKCPKRLERAARDPSVIFYAHNAEFERQIWCEVLVARHGWPDIPLTRWRCTAVLAAAANYPRALAQACIRAKVAQRKDARGGALIRKFCMPRKPTKANPATRIYPDDDPGAFEEFIEYCQQDVRSERGLHQHLPAIPEWEWDNYHFTCRMNDNGIPLDMELIGNATKIVDRLERIIKLRTQELTRNKEFPDGLRATQREKIMRWLDANGAAMENLTADSVEKHLSGTVHLPKRTRELLELRIEASRASTKKLVSMAAVACNDGRAHGTVMHYGAHTGRASGKLIQPHNFKRGWEDPRCIANALRALRTADYRFYAALYDKPMETLSNVIRGFIAAKYGKILLVVDYSQIEARLVDWYANNKKGLLEWASKVDKYKLMAGHIYQKDAADVTHEERRIGKNATLGCGFGMSAPAFLVYCHNVGATEVDAELAELAVGTYRSVNEDVVQLWSDTEEYCKTAIKNPGKKFRLRQLLFYMRDHWLVIKLPSGRCILYPYARLERAKTKWGKIKEGIVFDGMYGRTHTHGAKIVENFVQGTARDIMWHGMRIAEAQGEFFPVLNVHDEGVFEEPDTKHTAQRLKLLETMMCDVPEWLEGCPLEVKGFATTFYRKD